jgi:RsiW-degrading membrane proteinase PrsW (M82 family)
MKLRLKFETGSLAGQFFELESGFLTVGRGDNCSIRFDPLNERIVSKQHAFIEAKPDGFYITDNNSTNGTFLNGGRVQSIRLNSGDRVQFGRDGAVAIIEIDTTPAAPAAAQDSVIQELEKAAENKSIQNSLANLGLGSIEARPDKSSSKQYIGIGIAVILSVPLILMVVAIMFLSVGVIPAIIATFIAFVPAAFYILPLIAIDRYDPEPFWLLAFSFLWGALVAIIVSFIVNTVFGSFVYMGTGSAGAASILSAVVSAPLIEEASKGIGLLALLIFFRKYFDDILDGIVYGGVIALGFATVENVLYYGNGLNNAIMNFGLTSTALFNFLLLFTLRGILSPFAHVTFTAMTGVGCGISRESHNSLVRLISPVTGYIVAVLLHGIWNGLGLVVTIFFVASGLDSVCTNLGLGGQNIGLCGFFTFYLILEVPLFLIFVAFTFYIMRRQRRILNDMLAMDVARGLIPQEHLKTATSAFRSTSWLLSGIFSGKYLARAKYLRAVGKLGLSYWHIQRAQAAQGKTASFQQNPLLREEVIYWREKV